MAIREIGINTTSVPGEVEISSENRAWNTRLLKLAEQFPDQVRIIRMPEDNYGMLYATAPQEWFLPRPRRVLSEEAKAKAVQNLQNARLSEEK